MIFLLAYYNSLPGATFPVSTSPTKNINVIKIRKCEKLFISRESKHTVEVLNSPDNRFTRKSRKKSFLCNVHLEESAGEIRAIQPLYVHDHLAHGR